MVKNSGPQLLAVGLALIWPLYGLVTAAPLFIQLQQVNASRPFLSGANLNLLAFISSFTYTPSTINAGLDWTLLLGWVGVGYTFWKRNLRLVRVSLLSYLAVVFGLRYARFYTTIPVFPFLAIGIGALATDMVLVVGKRRPFKLGNGTGASE